MILCTNIAKKIFCIFHHCRQPASDILPSLRMKAVVAVISDLSTDMRVLKLARLMAEEGLSVTVIGRRSDSPVPEAMPGIRFVRIGVPFRKGLLMYLCFNGLLLIRLLFMPFSLCVASDLDTLVPCYLLTRFPGRRIIYDAHEYFTGQHGLPERRITHCLWKSVEKLILPRLTWMITVSDSIAGLYHSEYGVSPVVVRNVASAAGLPQPRSRDELGVAADELLVVLQGSGINPGRGGAELIAAMRLTRGVKLLIIGAGDEMTALKRQAEECRNGKGIIFLPRMPWTEMIRYTMACDAGLSLDHDSCINQRYSLPNKVFDYIAAGIPVIVSPLPEVKRVVEEYGCGLVIDEVTPEAIARQLQRVADDRLLLGRLREQTAVAAAELNWERERELERRVIRSVMDDITGRHRRADTPGTTSAKRCY